MEIRLTGKDIGVSIGVAIPILFSIIAGSYAVGLYMNSSRLEHQKDIVKEYERSTQLNAPGLVSSLNQSAQALTLSAHERKAFDVARNRVEDYAARIGIFDVQQSELNEKVIELTKSLSSNKEQYDSHVSALKQELESFLATSSIIVVKKGEAVELIPNHVMLGISSVYSDRAVFNINGDSVFLDLGESYNVKSSSSSCDVWLTKVISSPEEVVLKLVCSR
ncbi:hypothetical protein AB6C62_07570 [Vibrio splendidus]|uniref:hypothetical protein n=1 Tax=Vibrio splendidus TaxID=29497 RepID=UPI000C82441E|nr:hypothetical protein [Vibrio splendidus]PMO23711.1 hypothetical protein BCT15_09385 [Vibrio splendidus]